MWRRPSVDDLPLLEDACLDPLTSLAIIVNACMGMGFLSLPYTSVQLGPVVALVVILVLGAMALLTALWTAIALSLTAALARPGGDADVMAKAPIGRVPQGRSAELEAEDPFHLDKHVFVAYTEMVRAMWGDWAWRLASAALSVSLLIAMWAYAALVASSLAAMVPIPYLGGPCDVYDAKDAACPKVYQAFLLLFAALVVPLSAYSFKEQRWFQISMTVMRLLLVLSLVGDCVRMRLMEEAPPPPPGGVSGHTAGTAEPHSYDPARYPSIPPPMSFNLHALLEHIAVVMAALTVHMIIPEAIEELEEKPRNMLPTVGCAIGFCTVVYVCVSASVVFTFGNWTSPVCTLNWAHYTAGQPDAGWGAVVFRSWLLVVPTVDVTGAYPVLATSLSSTLRLWMPNAETTWQLRVACAVCPLFGAAAVFDLPKILGVVGVLMILFVFIIPPLLILSAERRCLKYFGAEKLYSSTYWRWHCDSRVTMTVLVLGVLVTLASAPIVMGFDKMLF